MLVTVGKKGKCVGSSVSTRANRPASVFASSRLNKYFDDPAKPMKSLIQDEYRGMLKAADVVVNFVRTGSTGRNLCRRQTCKECHPNTYQFWSTTKHAQAFESLKHDPKPNTIFDAECVTCHTTGFRIQLRLEVGSRDPAPGRQPVRKLPRARARSTSSDPTNAEFKQADHPECRARQQERPLRAVSRRRELAAF